MLQGMEDIINLIITLAQHGPAFFMLLVKLIKEEVTIGTCLITWKDSPG
jgi:hypothetical protein